MGLSRCHLGPSGSSRGALWGASSASRRISLGRLGRLAGFLEPRGIHRKASHVRNTRGARHPSMESASTGDWTRRASRGFEQQMKCEGMGETCRQWAFLPIRSLRESRKSKMREGSRPGVSCGLNGGGLPRATVPEGRPDNARRRNNSCAAPSGTRRTWEVEQRRPAADLGLRFRQRSTVKIYHKVGWQGRKAL